MKKYKRIIILLSIFIIILIIWVISFKHRVWEDTIICCNNKCFYIEIANNNESRQLWLMFRESLDNNKWMLFKYEKPWIYSFRMKNTLIPLAWIRLDSTLKVVDIKLMNPCKTKECPSYTPVTEAQYVLEINQQLISKKWILTIWDKCELK